MVSHTSLSMSKAAVADLENTESAANSFEVLFIASLFYAKPVFDLLFSVLLLVLITGFYEYENAIIIVIIISILYCFFLEFFWAIEN